MTVATAAIGLGSNLGQSRQILVGAIATLSNHSAIEVTTRSPWYRTTPVGGPPQPDFLNGCALLQTTLVPIALLQVLLQVEKQFGRERRERWGPRTLDLDLLLYDDLILTTPELTLPHPRMRDRPFVLVPLAEIAPDWQHPVCNQSIRALRDGLNCSGICPVEAP
ncbi:MAG: 2-amino-4-hydroxy-6-hydroxymethyldihydropteridine diphosphokinase [Cyanobacteria bacterium J06641_5]